MTLKDLLSSMKPKAVIGNEDIDITGVNIDSRRIGKGHLFVAMVGTQVDGHQFIPKAIAQGAAAILCERLPEETSEGVTYVDRKSVV